MQTRKMAARLQAATAGGRTPVLFLSKAASGHGNDMPLDERIAERVDVFAFMLHQLGVTFHPPER
jgi:prolyl oligopeptidase PreP (S9A serine peptidase family)